MNGYQYLVLLTFVMTFSNSIIVTQNANSFKYFQKPSPIQIFLKDENTLDEKILGTLTKLREVMKKKGIDIYVLPRTDENLNEYICSQDQRVRFITNFGGTYIDVAVIKINSAQIWTSNITGEVFTSNYWKIINISDNYTWYDNILENFDSKLNLQIDSRIISASQARLIKNLFSQFPHQINFSNNNLIDQIWIDRPKSNKFPLYIHQKWAGNPMSQKVSWIRQKIKEYEGEGALFGDLGEIAWILNLRSSQMPYKPYFKSYLLITLEGGILHLPENHPAFIDKNIINFLETQKIKMKNYEFSFPKKILIRPSVINYWMFLKIEKPMRWQGIQMFRAIRTEKQIEGFRNCNIRDGVALAKFWAWKASNELVSEQQAAKYLQNLRKQQQNNMGISFPTISAAGSNSAFLHYIPNKTKNKILKNNIIYMVDSGGQYLDGTTDVTRTFHFGTPTKQEKDSFTETSWRQYRMMTGSYLDRIARKYLSQKLLSYNHPTGHGVGYFGSVHQGPVAINSENNIDFKQNMIVTNQPGFYEPGKYGIRIQNMLCVKYKNSQDLTFQNLTLCPYDKNLIDLSLMKQADILFINQYHKRVWTELSPFLTEDKQTLQWLKIATDPI